MDALKFLHPGRVAPFTEVTWPTPGQWLAAAAPPELCRAGVHALLADVLATWIAEELWRVELDGGQELAPGIVVAPRGRLLGRVEAWNDQTAREFARACAAHVGAPASGRAAEYAADAAAAAEQAVAGDAATAGLPQRLPAVFLQAIRNLTIAQPLLAPALIVFSTLVYHWSP